MKTADRVTFGGGGLDRLAHQRSDGAALLSGPTARVLGFWRGRPLVTGDPTDGVRLIQLPSDHPLLAQAQGLRIFLGDAQGAPVFAVDLSAWVPDGDAARDPGPGRAAEDQPAPPLPDLPADARFADLRGLLAVLSPLDAEIAATGKGILEWHRSHGFCAACGAPSHPSEGGWQRTCPACGRPHFPRTDPAVIMLVTDGNSLLLGRSPGWPEGMYSLLAGFMEPGETVAAAVRREVAEETAVAIGRVRMLASQPWPWPASLMIGCAAEARSREITLDPVELDDALWVSREELLEVFAGRHPRIRQPRKGAIAHFLMQMWLADRLD